MRSAHWKKGDMPVPRKRSGDSLGNLPLCMQLSNLRQLLPEKDHVLV
jgi:hypothetical protein